MIKDSRKDTNNSRKGFSYGCREFVRLMRVIHDLYEGISKMRRDGRFSNNIDYLKLPSGRQEERSQ